MARDNFSKAVIEKLRARVAHRCSNITCRVPTSSPSSTDGVNSIGEAAHICAASPGGPRYDASMTAEERKSIDNAIWLCCNCATDIDKDVSRYPVNVLKGWKEQAEELARHELGKKIPSNNETIDTITAALTGLPKNFIPNAIANVHKSTAKSLESLDNRFFVKTAHDDGKTCVGIHAKEDVLLSLTVSPEKADEYIEKHRLLTEHGIDAEISSKGINVEGSKLIEEIFCGNDGVLQISSKKMAATQKLWLVSNETQAVETFDDIHGYISMGTKSFTFHGTACNGLFSFNYQKPIDKDNNKVDVSFSVNFDKWERLNIIALPYLEKLLSLFSRMAEGWSVFMALEVEGKKILSSEGITVDTWDYVLDISSFLHYVHRCKIISVAMGHNVSFAKDVEFTAEEHRKIADVVEIIEGKHNFTQNDLTTNASCVLLVDDESKNVQMLTDKTEPATMRMVEEFGETINLFGTEIVLPPRATTLYSVLPKLSVETENLKCGDEVTVEWIPQKDFKCIVSYETLSS